MGWSVAAGEPKTLPGLDFSTPMETYRAHRVLRADRSGSSWPVTIETDAGVFYMKLRGAAQGPTNLVAEIVVGALADVLGLSVPTRVLIDILPGIPIDDPHQELGHLLRFSIGRNLGFQLLLERSELPAG